MRLLHLWQNFVLNTDFPVSMPYTRIITQIRENHFGQLFTQCSLPIV
jgi:hypothetical protein